MNEPQMSHNDHQKEPNEPEWPSNCTMTAIEPSMTPNWPSDLLNEPQLPPNRPVVAHNCQRGWKYLVVKHVSSFYLGISIHRNIIFHEKKHHTSGFLKLMKVMMALEAINQIKPIFIQTQRWPRLTMMLVLTKMILARMIMTPAEFMLIPTRLMWNFLYEILNMVQDQACDYGREYN